MNSSPSSPPSERSRYARQVLFEQIGEEGQRRLGEARATLIGCGALGSVLAETLVRAGLGFLRICDRDFIERDNLQRQVLFDEDDVAASLPKAEAAARKLSRINSEVRIEAIVADATHANIESLCDGAEALLDGTDNFETRYLINDLAVKTKRPWVYGAVIGSSGLVMPVLPGETPCLRCVFDEPPPPEMNPTCDTAGVLAPAVNVVASLQAMEAMKLLMGRRDAVIRALLHVDVWTGRYYDMKVGTAREHGACACCVGGQFDYLSGRIASSTAVLCGRDAVQVRARPGTRIALAAIMEKLQRAGARDVKSNPFLLRATIDDLELTVFADGRAIIKGTQDVERARSVYARWIGA